MYYVYVLFSKSDQKFYIGYTNNLKRRLKEHSLGKTRSTIQRKNLQPLFYEAFVAKLDAQRRERYFKTTKGRASLRQILRESLVQVKLSGIV